MKPLNGISAWSPQEGIEHTDLEGSATWISDTATHLPIASCFSCTNEHQARLVGKVTEESRVSLRVTYFCV